MFFGFLVDHGHAEKGSNSMTSTEAIIYQLKNLKGKPLWQKLEHIFTYFWIPILVILVVLVFGISYIVHISTMKDQALNVTCLNSFVDSTATDTYVQEFAEVAGIDLKESEVQISTDLYISDEDSLGSYETVQIMVAQIASQSIDVVASDLSTLTRYFYHDYFGELTQFLTPEQQERYADRFLYMDMAMLRKLDEVTEEELVYPDPSDPGAMMEPVPVALAIPAEGDFMTLCYPYHRGTVAVGIIVNSQNVANARVFLDYIMEYEED